MNDFFHDTAPLSKDLFLCNFKDIEHLITLDKSNSRLP